jgi:hypothetical protein
MQENNNSGLEASFSSLTRLAATKIFGFLGNTKNLQNVAQVSQDWRKIIHNVDKDNIHGNVEIFEVFLKDMESEFLLNQPNPDLSRLKTNWLEKILLYQTYYKRDIKTNLPYAVENLKRTSKDTLEQAIAFNHLGASQLIGGDYKKDECFESAIKILKNLEANLQETEKNQQSKVYIAIQKNIAFALRNESYVYHRLANDKKNEKKPKEEQQYREQAEKCIRGAIEIQTRIKESIVDVDRAESNHALGTVLMGQNRLEEARDVFQNAITQWKKIQLLEGLHPAMSVTMQSLALCLMLMTPAPKDDSEKDSNKDVAKKNLGQALRLIDRAIYFQYQQLKTTLHTDTAKSKDFRGQIIERLASYELATYEDAKTAFQESLAIKAQLTPGLSMYQVTVDAIKRVDEKINAQNVFVVQAKM